MINKKKLIAYLAEQIEAFEKAGLADMLLSLLTVAVMVSMILLVVIEIKQWHSDGHTDIEFKGKPAPDSKRYKAIGNGMAHPCASFVLAQIVKAENKSWYIPIIEITKIEYSHRKIADQQHDQQRCLL